MNLSIGCGRKRLDGWVTIDADASVGADFVSMVPPLPDAVRAQRWDAVEILHFIEHVFPWQAVELMEQVFGCMAPGGILVMEQPDLLFACRVLAGIAEPIPGTEPGQCDYWPLFGDPSHRNPLFGHKWGYTPGTLSDLLRSVGFAEIQTMKAHHHVPGRDFRVEARK